MEWTARGGVDGQVWVGRPGVGWTPVATVAAGPDRLQLRWQWRASAQFTGEGLREPALTPRRRRVRIRLLPRTGGRPSRDPRHGSRTLRPARRPAGPPVHPPASAGRRVRRPRHARPSLCASVGPVACVRRPRHARPSLCASVGPVVRVRRPRHARPSLSASVGPATPACRASLSAEPDTVRAQPPGGGGRRRRRATAAAGPARLGILPVASSPIFKICPNTRLISAA